MSENQASPAALKRDVGLFGAVMMGMGSIVGTGVFVSLGVGAGVAGPAVLLAVTIAAFVATCNGLSSAQLAAAHPVSGGTYEYGYRFLNPVLGFCAGWMYLLAKSASAATAALGFAGYLLHALGVESSGVMVPLALGAVGVITGIVLGGIRRSNVVNTLIVSLTLSVLAFFVFAGLPEADFSANLTPFFPPDSTVGAVLHASALMFVAYTGYGRVATLGEEVKEPEKTIPRAVIMTLSTTLVLYLAVTVVALGVVGAEDFAAAAGEKAAPLEIIASGYGVPGAGLILAVGAVTAMLGVLLNLVLGLSRVLFAMGRRVDMPGKLGEVSPRNQSPTAAIVVMGMVIAALVLVGDVKATWSFSAFTVLLYYSLTNISALAMPAELRRYPRIISVLGLVGCLGLAFWVEWIYWVAGVGLLLVGLLVRAAVKATTKSK